MVKPHMTAEELLEVPDSFGPCELVRGELRRLTPAGFPHGAIVMKASRIIGNFVDSNRLGVTLAADTGFTLERAPDTVRAPDVAFVSKSRIPAPEDRVGFAELAPDLIVEVLSPGNRPAEMQERIDDFLRAGVRLVWVLDPRSRTIEEYHAGTRRTLPADGTLTGHDVLPGFACGVADLFAWE